jgi:hypothetical protein
MSGPATMAGTDSGPASVRSADRSVGTAYQEGDPWDSTVPPCESSRQHVSDLLALIRQHVFNPSAAPADALIDIRDALREFAGEFADQE